MNRRGFLGSILAAGVAPFVCTQSGLLMPGRGVIARLQQWEFGPHNTITFTFPAASAYHVGTEIIVHAGNVPLEPSRAIITDCSQAQQISAHGAVTVHKTADGWTIKGKNIV